MQARVQHPFRVVSLPLSAVDHSGMQMAARAQKASVEPAEIERYERYNERHGAKLAGVGGPGEEEEEW